MLVIKETGKMEQMRKVRGKKVVVIGAARQGIALTRYLLKEGASVVLNDRLPSDQVSGAKEALAGEPVKWILGGHPPSLLDDADLVCISGGVPFDLPIVELAKQRDIEVTNDSQIFLEVAPCRVIGITGSAGKTTTTTLVGLIARAAVEELQDLHQRMRTVNQDFLGDDNGLSPESKIWVGGNIGTPLLSSLDQMLEHDLAVMELSSFQLEVMKSSPEIAAILNITPNHLDRHKTMEAYSAAKARILSGQSENDVAILNSYDPATWNLANQVHGRLVSFGEQGNNELQDGAFLSADREWILISSPSSGSREVSYVMRCDQVPLRGEHNLQNVLAACAISFAAGFSISAMKTGVRKFKGIPHRLELVRTWGGADWYNDSIATAPERAIAAVNSFSEPLILLAGGQDKDLPWDSFAETVLGRVKSLILFGEASEKILQVLKDHPNATDTTILVCAGLQEAVDQAAKQVSSGDIVLLSPGGTSFDEFHDFEARGEAFRKWVMELP